MKRQEQRRPQEVMLVLAWSPGNARGRYRRHLAPPPTLCPAGAPSSAIGVKMADLRGGLLAAPLPQPPVPMGSIYYMDPLRVETRGRERPYRPRGGFISMEPILASGTAQETSNFLKREGRNGGTNSILLKASK